jgi:ABC-type lipoprotein export system ATPase subunit
MQLSRTYGQTFVLVTHNLPFAAMAHRVLRLDGGQLHPVAATERANWLPAAAVTARS